MRVWNWLQIRKRRSRSHSSHRKVTMFDIREALKDLDGKTMRGGDLLKQLKEIRSAHYGELPLEYTTDDLYMEAGSRGWIHETPEGLLHIDLR
jgi:hypothetical protein